MGAEGIYMGTRFMATRECPISESYKQAMVDAQSWDPKYRDRALAPPKAEEYEKVMKEKGEAVTGEWLMRLERVLIKESPDVPRDWQSDLRGDDPEVAVRLTGGSLAVGVIDSVVSVKELIDTIVREAEQILGQQGNLGSLLA